jgi:hypothetical protein
LGKLADWDETNQKGLTEIFASGLTNVEEELRQKKWGVNGHSVSRDLPRDA